MITKNSILILDYGSQYAQLIARKVRSLNVYTEIVSYDITKDEFNAFDPVGVIISGGPTSVKERKLPGFIFKNNIPILGICYGLQALVDRFGGVVGEAHNSEYGTAVVKHDNSSLLLNDTYDTKLNDYCYLNVVMSHTDTVISIPDRFSVIAIAQNTENIVAIEDIEKDIYGVQFHPEVDTTSKGIDILKNFVFDICNVKPNWTTSDIINSTLSNINNIVGDTAKVLLAVSGGVDSTVAAKLIYKAIGDRLLCVFIDTGLLRKNEREEVIKILEDNDIPFKWYDLSKVFLKRLKNITDPEEKRKMIGKAFIHEFTNIIDHNHLDEGIEFLGQGTIYPDVIESGNGNTKTIKSHHNVGGLPDVMALKLLEPLRYMFKDEVRSVGKRLGLSFTTVNRHPCPGPALAIRIMGEVTEERLTILREADSIFMDELNKNHWYNKVSQAFAVFLPINTVGVVGDNRTYGNVIALRAVVTKDFMTAECAEIPYKIIFKVSTRIVNEVDGVCRVVYDVSGKPPATIEWE